MDIQRVSWEVGADAVTVIVLLSLLMAFVASLSHFYTQIYRLLSLLSEFGSHPCRMVVALSGSSGLCFLGSPGEAGVELCLPGVQV